MPTPKTGTPAHYDPIAELVRVNPVASVIMDRETLAIVVVNQATVALLGYSEEELVGRPVTDLVPVEDIAAVHHAAEEPPPEGETQWRCLRKDGVMLHLKLKYRDTIFRGTPARFIVVVTS